MMCTDRELFQDKLWHSHSCLASMHKETMILYFLEQPDTITKFTVLECKFLIKEVGGRVKVSLNLYRMVSKFCSIKCLICCFSDELKMRIG